MGRVLYSVESLVSPVVFAEERIIDIPPDGKLYVENQAVKLLIFLEADHTHHLPGRPDLLIQSGDALIVPYSGMQVYHSNLLRKKNNIHTIRIVYDIPLIPAPTQVEAAIKRHRSKSQHPSALLRSRLDRDYHIAGFLKPNRYELIAHLREEAEKRKLGYRMQISSLCYQLTVECLRDISPETAVPRGEAQTKAAIITERSKEFILENFQRALTLEEIAWEVKLSREHLARVFRETTGETVFDYLYHVRIEQAKQMLADPTCLVTDVAHQSGFSSPTLFGRTFKRLTSLTPQAYRKNLLTKIKFTPSIRQDPEKRRR